MGSMAHNGVEHTHVFAILPRWRRVGMVVGEASLQTALHIRWQIELVPVCLHADIGDAQPTISALDPDTPFSTLRVTQPGLQNTTPNLPLLLLPLPPLP